MSTKVLTLDQIRDLIAKCAGVAVDTADLAAVPPKLLDEFHVDSLGLLGVITELEREYGIKLDDATETVKTAQDVVRLVNERLVATGQVTVGHTENSIVIDAPFDVVWEMTNDVESWPRLFSEYAEATVLERRGDSVRFRLALHPDGEGVVWSWVSERTVDRAARKVTARRVETGPFEYMHINWWYDELPDGIRMRWVQDFAMRDTAPVTTAQMTAHINSNSVVQLARIRGLVEAAALAGRR